MPRRVSRARGYGAGQALNAMCRATGHRPGKAMARRGGRHTLKGMVEAGEGHFTITFTDKSTSYVNIADYADISISGMSEKSTTEETLERVPMAIGNAERNFVGTYHKIKAKHLRPCPNGSVHKLDAGYFRKGYSTDRQWPVLQQLDIKRICK